jgi:DNA-binding CsgD family transcriptional regulator
MKDKDLKNNEELTQEDASLATQRRGNGARVITEYLFFEPPSVSSSSDEVTEALSDEEEHAIARVVHFFLKAEYEKTVAEAERCINSRHPEISVFALLAHAVANVALNKIEVARKDFQVLEQEAQHPENKRIAVLNDIYRFVLSAFFHLGEEIDPIPLENFFYYSEGARLFALYAQSYALYLQQDYAQALGVADAALMMAADRHPIICIYLNLAASMSAMNLSRFEQADRFFLNALQIAKPEGYFQPFIGHHGPLQGLVEKHIRDREPELYKMISEKVIRFRRGWTEIHNPLSYDKVTNLLTPYEFALAMMAAKGKTNQEIANYLHISISTVKAYLSTIFQKVGITKRSELKKYLVK